MDSAFRELYDASAGMLEAFKEVVESGGVTHDSTGCPEDDTCSCENVKRVNDSMNRVRLALREIGW